MNNNALKIFPFPHTPNLQENETEKTVSDLLTESVTTGARACARTRESDLLEIAQYYCESFGAAAMPPVAKRQILAAMESGLEPSLVYTAIDEAGLAPRPSWAYAAAILRRLVAEGCHTQEAYAQRQAAWRKRRGLDELPF